MRTCARLGIRTVAVYSDADWGSPHVRAADVAVRIGAGPAAESYLRFDGVLGAAATAGGEAIHPGYGFLSENAAFAERVRRRGARLGGAARCGHAGAGGQGAREGARGIGRRADPPRLPRRGRDRCGAARGCRCDRVPVAGQGERGWRRARDAGRPAAGRARRGVGGGAARGGGVVRRRPAPARALPRAATPRGGPGPRRRPRGGRAPGRARVQRAAATPEADRGVAVAGGIGGAANVDGGGRAATGPRGRIPGRGHGRVPARRRRGVLLPRGQRAAPGGAPGDGGGHGARPRRAAAAGRGR